jgi:hypothetical protein
MRGSARIARRNRDTLALTTGQLDAALADDRVVAVRELADELVAVRDAARVLDVVERGGRIGVADVVRNRSVEEKVFLQHGRKLMAGNPSRRSSGEIRSVH